MYFSDSTNADETSVFESTVYHFDNESLLTNKRLADLCTREYSRPEITGDLLDGPEKNLQLEPALWPPLLGGLQAETTT